MSRDWRADEAREEPPGRAPRGARTRGHGSRQGRPRQIHARRRRRRRPGPGWAGCFPPPRHSTPPPRARTPPRSVARARGSGSRPRSSSRAPRREDARGTDPPRQPSRARWRRRRALPKRRCAGGAPVRTSRGRRSSRRTCAVACAAGRGRARDVSNGGPSTARRGFQKFALVGRSDTFQAAGASTGRVLLLGAREPERAPRDGRPWRADKRRLFRFDVGVATRA